MMSSSSSKCASPPLPAIFIDQNDPLVPDGSGVATAAAKPEQWCTGSSLSDGTRQFPFDPYEL